MRHEMAMATTLWGVDRGVLQQEKFARLGVRPVLDRTFSGADDFSQRALYPHVLLAENMVGDTGFEPVTR
jgi:hypothetical protein